MRMVFIPIPTSRSDQKPKIPLPVITLKSESTEANKKIRLTFSDTKKGKENRF